MCMSVGKFLTSRILFRAPVKLEVSQIPHHRAAVSQREMILAGAEGRAWHLPSKAQESALSGRGQGLLRMPQALAKDDSKEKDSKIPSINKNISAM